VSHPRNVQAAEHFELIGKLIAIQESRLPEKGKGFRARAFLNAAKAMREHADEVSPDFVVPGMGASTRTALCQFLENGSSDKLDDLNAELPGVVDSLTLTRIKGIGPVVAIGIAEKHGIPNFDEFVKRAKEGTLPEKLKRFASSAVHASELVSGRIEFAVAWEIAQGILKQVSAFTGAIQVEVCGSLRRRRPTIKDCDIVVSAEANHHAGIHEAFRALGARFSSGEVKTTIYVERFATTLQCDIWTVEPWWFGAALNYATGSKEHNVHLRAMAKRRGMRIDEKGIFRMLSYPEGRMVAKVDGLYHEGEKVAERLGGEKETDIYEVLGIPYVEPKDRG
jgi:DNA polymerase (family 10)